MGFFVIFFGFITDLLTAYAGFAALLPLFLKSFLQSHLQYEEYYDTIGLGLVCLSAIYHFYDEIGPLVKKNILSFLFVFISISLIAMGNGFAHWQYRPGVKLTLISLLITLIGLSVFVIINEKILVNRFRIKASLINRGPYYLFLYSIFVMLPTVCGRIYDIACLVLWLPLLLALTLYLYYRRIIKIDAKD